jgi:hypothetical protein
MIASGDDLRVGRMPAWPRSGSRRDEPGGTYQFCYLMRFASATQFIEDATDEPCRFLRLGRDGRLLAIPERLENCFHFPVDWKTAGLRLREKQRVIDDHVELTGRARRDFGRLAKPPFE